jgi:ABC-type antimicrobial peptide transport system permease subunit
MRNRIGKRTVTFTILDAAKFGYNHIKRRLDRAIINIASIALATSFLTSIILSDIFYKTYSMVVGVHLSIEIYQYWLIFVALIVSIVSITNSMLIAVHERYNEIGTMKCIGALDKHIVMLFLIEASIQGFLGGAIGFVLGIIAALFSTGFITGFNIILYVSMSSIILLIGKVVILSISLSMIATVYPAWRAAKLDPVEALRFEL